LPETQIQESGFIWPNIGPKTGQNWAKKGPVTLHRSYPVPRHQGLQELLAPKWPTIGTGRRCVMQARAEKEEPTQVSA